MITFELLYMLQSLVAPNCLHVLKDPSLARVKMRRKLGVMCEFLALSVR